MAIKQSTMQPDAITSGNTGPNPPPQPPPPKRGLWARGRDMLRLEVQRATTPQQEQAGGSNGTNSSTADDSEQDVEAGPSESDEEPETVEDDIDTTAGTNVPNIHIWIY